jgi:uncharacterized membrane protein
MDPLIIKYVHIISATVLFGTGMGTAFHGFMNGLGRHIPTVMTANRNVVLADWLFTTPAAIIQPITGVWLALEYGYPLTSGWIVASFALYLLVGACWLPVVWLQVQMHRMARDAHAAGTALPDRYERYARIWFLLGIPAFTAMLGIFYLMIFRPSF